MTTLAYLHNGLGTGADDGTSQADAYRNMASALAGVAADTIVLSYDGGSGETLSTSPTASTDAGINNTIRFVGVNSSFAVEAGVRYTLDANSTAANAMNINGKFGYIFDNFVFTNATSHNINVATGWSFKLYNCIVSNSGASGVYITTGRNQAFILTQFLNNTGRGVFATTYDGIAYMCLFEGNTSVGIQAGSYNTVISCIMANNGTGIYNPEGGSAVGNVFYNNTNAITTLTNYKSFLAAHNIFMDNTTVFNATHSIIDYSNAWRGNTGKYYQAVIQNQVPYGDSDLDLGSDPFDGAGSDDWTTTQPNAQLIGLESIIDANNSVFKSIGIEPVRSAGGGGNLIDGSLIL